MEEPECFRQEKKIKELHLLRQQTPRKTQTSKSLSIVNSFALTCSTFGMCIHQHFQKLCPDNCAWLTKQQFSVGTSFFVFFYCQEVVKW